MIFLFVLLYLALAIFIGLVLISVDFRDAVVRLPQQGFSWCKRHSLRLLMAIPTPFSRTTSTDQHHLLWTLLAVSVLISAPMLWVITQKNQFQVADYESLNQSRTDPKILALLEGELLQPPPAPPEEAFAVLDAELATHYAQTVPSVARPAEVITPSTAPSHHMVHDHVHGGYINIRNADRNWKRMNSQFVQRLLLVYKIMKEQHGYDMVLLEGYRSPERQNSLSRQVTGATGYRSYHQFGLAADSAFMRDGKIVISERDPWAMRGYQLYGQVAASVGLTWGGNWKLRDYGHVELRIKGVLGKPEMALKLTNE
ncbi:MAG: M15 family metallopeptidase [Pseudomonadota bacterium]|nr:M15 family metallopeptidase [Pseudomonadota bacterium]